MAKIQIRGGGIFESLYWHAAIIQLKNKTFPLFFTENIYIDGTRLVNYTPSHGSNINKSIIDYSAAVLAAAVVSVVELFTFL